MMETLYGNGLLLLGLWVSTSLVMLLIWGVLAWAVVNILSRQRFGRRWAGATNYRNSHHLHQTVGSDSGRRARSGPENRSAICFRHGQEQIRAADDSVWTDVAHS